MTDIFQYGFLHESNIESTILFLLFFVSCSIYLASYIVKPIKHIDINERRNRIENKETVTELKTRTHKGTINLTKQKYQFKDISVTYSDKYKRI